MASRVMGLFRNIQGQDVALSILRRALRENRLASAYLFEGPSGVGKEQAAIALARTVISGGDPNIADRIDRGMHPDLRIFRPREEGARNLLVETFREEILPIVQFAPFEAKKAFVIFPDADISFPENHPESANAFLKTLEEPPPSVHFILLASRPDRLLDTTRSRCQRVRFAPLEVAVLDEILRRENITDEAVRGASIALSGGRADRALELARGSRVEDLFELALAIDRATSERKPGTRLERAEELRSSSDLQLALEALAIFYRDLVQLGAGREAALAFAHKEDELRARARGLSIAKAAESEGRVRRALADLERGANAQIVTEALLFELARIR